MAIISKTFFKNFNESMNVPSWLKEDPYNGTGIPQLDDKKNSTQWKNRVAVPFSYAPKNSQYYPFERQYGILYLPMSEADKIKKDGTVRTDDVDIYGAELQDGPSLTANGFRNLFNNESRTFRIEKQAVSDDIKTNDRPTVEASSGKFLKALREAISRLQEGQW